MSDHETIVNHQPVVDAFGQWPSFHDGEVHRIVLDRTRRLSNGSCYPSIGLVVRGWTMTSEGINAGFYKQEHDSIIHFLIKQFSDLELDGT